jgi:hypothetical protein
MWWGDLFEFNGISNDLIHYYFYKVTYNEEYFSVVTLNIYTNVIKFYGDIDDTIPEKKFQLNKIFTVLGGFVRRESDMFYYDVVYKDVKYSHACVNIHGSVSFYINEDDKDYSYYVSSFFSNEEKIRYTREYTKDMMEYDY